MYRVKWFHVASVFVLALGLAIPAMAQSVASTDFSRAPEFPTFNSELPGSVIVFPRFVRGTTKGEPNSQFEISAVCPPQHKWQDSNYCDSWGDKVQLRAHWVCPGDNDQSICQETDFALSTTVYGTLTFNPENVGASAFPTSPGSTTPGGTVRVPHPPCDKGYLIAWVVDENGKPMGNNILIGDAIIRDANGSISGYNAIPIQANDEKIILGEGNSLPFTGERNAYAKVSGSFQSSVRFERGLATPPAVSTQLTLLTLDVHSGRPNDSVIVPLEIYNANEILVSNESVRFVCWAERYLSDVNDGDFSINTNLTEAGMGTQKGLIVSGPITPLDRFKSSPSILGIVTTSVFDGKTYAYSYSLYHDSNFVSTKFDPQ
jgi:hypothetical protein